MKHFLIVTVVALITLFIVFAWYRPDILEDMWLWVIGLIGPIIGFAQELIKKIQKKLKPAGNVEQTDQLPEKNE